MKHINQNGSIQLILAAVIVFVLIGGVGVYVATGGFGRNETQGNETAIESPEQTETQEQSSNQPVELLKQALTGGDAVVCDFSQEGSTGTAYVASAGKVRVDAETEEGQAHFIYKDDTAYFWLDGKAEGFKATSEEDNEVGQQLDAFDPETLEQEAEANNLENLDCTRQAIDGSKLELPQNVTFKTFEEYLQGASN